MGQGLYYVHVQDLRASKMYPTLNYRDPPTYKEYLYKTGHPEPIDGGNMSHPTPRVALIMGLKRWQEYLTPEYYKAAFDSLEGPPRRISKFGGK